MAGLLCVVGLPTAASCWRAFAATRCWSGCCELLCIAGILRAVGRAASLLWAWPCWAVGGAAAGCWPGSCDLLVGVLAAGCQRGCFEEYLEAIRLLTVGTAWFIHNQLTCKNAGGVHTGTSLSIPETGPALQKETSRHVVSQSRFLNFRESAADWGRRLRSTLVIKLYNTVYLRNDQRCVREQV